MSVETLRRSRRALTAGVLMSAFALVMARTSHDEDASLPAGVASAAFVICLVLLVVFWRREHAAAEAEFRARELQTLAMLRMQAELAKRARAQGEEAGSGEASPGQGTSSGDA